MSAEDQLATLFITPFGTFCYSSMPFGLKNAGATFQRRMRCVFGDLIGKLVEAYIDNIVVNSKQASDLVTDLITNLTAIFEKLRTNNVKLNPEKCVFGVPRGMLLGFVISERGIEVNPKKVAAITLIGPIGNVKDVQRVTGCLAALSRFIARLGE